MIAAISHRARTPLEAFAHAGFVIGSWSVFDLYLVDLFGRSFGDPAWAPAAFMMLIGGYLWMRLMMRSVMRLASLGFMGRALAALSFVWIVFAAMMAQLGQWAQNMDQSSHEMPNLRAIHGSISAPNTLSSPFVAIGGAG